MVFSAMLAMSSLGANIAARGTRERSPESLKYYQIAVSLLRQRLADDVERSSDAVIITLSNLCGFEVIPPSLLKSDHQLTGSDVSIRQCRATMMPSICILWASDTLWHLEAALTAWVSAPGDRT